MQHLDDGLIQELVDGEVPSADLLPIQRHLAECESCQSRLEAARTMIGETDALIEMLDDEAAPAPSALVIPRKKPTWPRHLAWAASLVLAVGLGYAGRDLVRIAPPPVSDTPVAEAATDQQKAPAPLPEAADEPVAEAHAQPSSARTPPRRADEEASPPPAPAELRDAVTSKQIVTEQQSGARPVPGAVGGAVPAAPPSADRGQRFEQLIPRDQASSEFARSRLAAAPEPIVVDTIDLPEAMRRLGGSIRLIDGLVPARLVGVGGSVQVEYATSLGAVLLIQRPGPDSLLWRLQGPEEFPTDSLQVLRRRVQR